MKKNIFCLLSLFLAATSCIAVADESEATLEQQLERLSLPDNQALTLPGESEKLYSVQTRFSPLKYKQEVDFGVGRNFTGDSSIDSNEFYLGYRFHFSDKWNISLEGAAVFNSLSASTVRLMEKDAVVPDSTYTKYRAGLMVNYNLFYGKFRLGMDQVFYFDQYIGAGPGVVVMERGTQPAAILEAGFAFWLGKWGSIRLGLKDYVHSEQRRLSSGMANDLVAHLNMGFLFGGGKN